MPKRLLHVLPSLISLVLLVASLWVIHGELRQYEGREIWQQLLSIPWQSVSWAIALTVLNVLVFSGYDTLAVQYVRHPLSYLQTTLAAVTSIPISNTVGFALLSGSAVRYRFYAPWGVPPLKIAQIIAFCNLSFWLGLFIVGGVLFLVQPVSIPSVLHLPFQTAQPIGMIFLSVITGYVLWNLWSQKAIRIGNLVIPHLPMQLCVGQIVVSSLDWTLAAAVLYALLPQSTSLSYATYFGVYLLAQFAGVVSNVPGGLGVFETVVLLLLSPSISAAALFGALVAYRTVYYLLPLIVAVLLLGGYEMRSRLNRRSSNPD